MILLYDTVQENSSHAPFTRAFTEMMAYAYPTRPITIHGNASHLRAAFDGPDPLLEGRLTQRAIPSVNGQKKNIRDTLRLLSDTYVATPLEQPIAVFLTGGPHNIWGAKLFRRYRADFRCHLVLHGDINSIRGPRSRNPLYRLSDYTGSLSHINHRDIRFIVLEPHIKDNLAALLPAVANRIDVLPHPCTPVNFVWPTTDPPAGPARFGLLGIAGRSKGLDVFAQVAKRVASNTPLKADFRLIGKVQHGWRDLDLTAISGPRPFSEEWLPRSVFEQELQELRYLVLPYDPGYYELAASGVLLDALRSRKPIIFFRNPALTELCNRFGEIGHVCVDEDDMVATVEGLLTNFDKERYQAQRRNLDAAYRSRLPEALAPAYLHLRQAAWNEQPSADKAAP